MPNQDYRIEKDSLGEIRVPGNALYMPQTQRAVENFRISGLPFWTLVYSSAGSDQIGGCGRQPGTGLLRDPYWTLKAQQALGELARSLWLCRQASRQVTLLREQ
jgi:fumarate hydratase class II